MRSRVAFKKSKHEYSSGVSLFFQHFLRSILIARISAALFNAYMTFGDMNAANCFARCIIRAKVICKNQDMTTNEIYMKHHFSMCSLKWIQIPIQSTPEMRFGISNPHHLKLLSSEQGRLIDKATAKKVDGMSPYKKDNSNRLFHCLVLRQQFSYICIKYGNCNKKTSLPWQHVAHKC